MAGLTGRAFVEGRMRALVDIVAFATILVQTVAFATGADDLVVVDLLKEMREKKKFCKAEKVDKVTNLLVRLCLSRSSS